MKAFSLLFRWFSSIHSTYLISVEELKKAYVELFAKEMSPAYPMDAETKPGSTPDID